MTEETQNQKIRVMVNGEQHGPLYDADKEGVWACLNAAVDVINPPQELRKLFLYQLATGKQAMDGKQDVWVEEAPVESAVEN